MSVFTEDLVNVSGIRTPDASSVLYAFLVNRRILILLCAWRIHKEHVHVLRREHLEVFPICYILIFEKVFWACQNYLQWGCYRSNQFDFPVFLLIEGVSYRVDIYPEVTMDMNKGQWTKPGICHGSSEKCFDSFHGAERSFNIGSGHCNCQKKKNTVRLKEMFEFNSASKESRPTGFQTPACSVIKWSSAAILCRFFGINSYAVKVGFRTIVWSSSSSTILDVYRQTRCTRRISNNGMGNLPHHYFGASDALHVWA